MSLMSNIRSIHHQFPYSYKNTPSPELKQRKKEMEESEKMVTIAIVLMIVVWVIRKFIMKK